MRKGKSKKEQKTRNGMDKGKGSAPTPRGACSNRRRQYNCQRHLFTYPWI